MTTAPTVKQAQSARSQAALIEAATALFAERGYRGTSVQAIGERAGVSRGSIFWHFDSKEGLLWAVVERAFEAWEAEVLLPDVGEATGVEAMSRALAAHRRFLIERDGSAASLLRPDLRGARPAAGACAGVRAAPRQPARDDGRLDPAGDRRGEMRDDVDASSVVTFITGALGGIAYQWLLDPGGFDLDRVYEDLEKTLARGMR